MAKTQKGMLLNDDLLRLISQVERSSGASFTRIVTAAILQHLFEEPEGPNPLWMEYAVGLELGEIGVGDMPTERMKYEEDRYAAEQGLHGMEPSGEPMDLKLHMRRRAKKWGALVARPGGDKIGKIINHRKETKLSRRMDKLADGPQKEATDTDND